MVVLKPKAAPDREGVAWDGANTDEVLALVGRVAGLGCWGALPIGSRLTAEVRTEEPHLGLNIARDDGTVVVRVELGNVVVFDLFAATPLYVMHPDHLAAFYEAG